MPNTLELEVLEHPSIVASMLVTLTKVRYILMLLYTFVPYSYFITVDCIQGGTLVLNSPKETNTKFLRL